MDESIMHEPIVYRAVRFRQPTEIEVACGLWVDRIGSAENSGKNVSFRILGQYAVIAVEAGSGVIETHSGGCWPVRRGDAMLVDPSEPIRYHPDGTWRTRWIVWNGAEAFTLQKSGLLDLTTPVAPFAEPTVRVAHATLMEQMNNEDRQSALERKITILQLVSTIARIKQEHNPLQAGRREAMTWIITHIQKHLNEALRVQALAGRCHLSEPQFRREFRRFTGQSPQAFIAAQRTARAKALLSRGETIKQVAAAVGYPDPFHFMRVFKRMTGQTPGRFVRESHDSPV